MPKTTKTSQKSIKQSQRPTQKPKHYHKLPKTLAEKEFNEFFLPHLSLPKRSRRPAIPLYRIFNYILYQMDTGCQWDKIPIKINPQTGKKEICHTSVWRWFDRWSGDGSFEKAFIVSVKQLKDKNKLKLQRIHGDGTNSLAKKGAIL
jgi:transposase